MGLVLSFNRLKSRMREHMRAQNELAFAEKRIRALLENSPVCTKIVDLDLNLQCMSSAGIKGFGIDDVTQFYGDPYPFSFYPGSFRNIMTANLQKAKKTDQVITQEAAVVDAKGNELW